VFQELVQPAQLTGAPTMLAGSANLSVVGEFPGEGAWTHTSASGWVQTTPTDAVLLMQDGYGDIVVDVSGQGVFRYRKGVQTQLSSTSPAVLAG
jgi:hypothetical protein